MSSLQPLTPYPHLLHGGDYNLAQWLEAPEIWTQAGQAMVAVTHSPFLGERDALNILGSDVAGLGAGVARVTK